MFPSPIYESRAKDAVDAARNVSLKLIVIVLLACLASLLLGAWLSTLDAPRCERQR